MPIAVLRGSVAKAVTSKHFDKLPLFGAGKHRKNGFNIIPFTHYLSQDYWIALFWHLVRDSYIIDNFVFASGVTGGGYQTFSLSTVFVIILYLNVDRDKIHFDDPEFRIHLSPLPWLESMISPQKKRHSGLGNLKNVSSADAADELSVASLRLYEYLVRLRCGPYLPVKSEM